MKKILLTLSILFTLSLLISTESDAALPVIIRNDTIPLSECVFFGDSTTYGLFRYNVHNDGSFGNNYHTLQDSQVWTPKSGTFYLGNLLTCLVDLPDYGEIPLEKAVRSVRPRCMILTVGINGLSSWNQDSLTRYYQKLIDTIQKESPSTTIVLQSVYPIAGKAKETFPKFSNGKIDLVNSWISSLASSNHIMYLNTASVLKNENGFLCDSYHNGDGLHFSTEGFNAMLKYVEEVLSGQKGAA